MDVEKDGKIFMGVGIGVGLIITIIGGSYLLQEKKNSNHNNSREESVSHREKTLHERLLRATNAEERLKIFKNSHMHPDGSGVKSKKRDKHHKHKSRKHK
jgi:hypothetical protein